MAICCGRQAAWTTRRSSRSMAMGRRSSRARVSGISHSGMRANGAYLGVSEATRLSKNQPERSEEHTSELQSRLHLVCRLLLEKKKKAASSCYTESTRITATLRVKVYD